MNSVSTFWHGVKVDPPPEITPVARACSSVERHPRPHIVPDRHNGTGPERVMAPPGLSVLQVPHCVVLQNVWGNSYIKGTIYTHLHVYDR